MPSETSDRKRKRGVVLTPLGAQTLRDAITQLENEENFGRKLTIAELGFRTRLTPETIAKVLDTEQGVDRRTLDNCFRTLNLELCESDYCRADLGPTNPLEANIPPPIPSVQIDWGEAPDISIFHGRAQELETLTQWIQVDRCRVITLLGMGGIGKTKLAAKLVSRLSHSQEPPAFEQVIWRSLRHAPPIEEILDELLRKLSNQPNGALPTSLNQAISQLMQILQQARCLLVLDNVEAILQPKERTGCYQVGFEGYGELIRRMGDSPHNSCLILTSREQLHEIRLLEGKEYSVRSHLLKGLLPQDSLKILQAEGIGTTDLGCQTLVEQYEGNPLHLKMAANTIQLLFLGQVSHFLAQETAAFGSICTTLEQQLERLSDLEKTVICWLANHNKPILLPDLVDAFLPTVTRQKLLGVIESLAWRSLLKRTPTGFATSAVMMDYVTSQHKDP